MQSHDEAVADTIRNAGKSKYDRQAFYASLPHKEKIRINLNIVKPFLHTKEQLTACLKHYDNMGFNSIKLSDMQAQPHKYANIKATDLRKEFENNGND